MRNDSVVTADALFGEPHHRHMAYDAAHKQVFVANRAMNRVEVPGPQQISITNPDGETASRDAAFTAN